MAVIIDGNGWLPPIKPINGGARQRLPITGGEGPLPSDPVLTEPPYPTVVNSPPPLGGVNFGSMSPVMNLGKDFEAKDPVVGIPVWVWLLVLVFVIVIFVVV